MNTWTTEFCADRYDFTFANFAFCVCVCTYVHFVLNKSFSFWCWEFAGFANPLGSCCGGYGVDDVECGKTAIVNGTEVFGASCSNPSVYISWDSIHYSHAANKWVANQILNGNLSDPAVPITKACRKPVLLWSQTQSSNWNLAIMQWRSYWILTLYQKCGCVSVDKFFFAMK